MNQPSNDPDSPKLVGLNRILFHESIPLFPIIKEYVDWIQILPFLFGNVTNVFQILELYFQHSLIKVVK